MFVLRRVFAQSTFTCTCRNLAKYSRRQDPGISRQKKLLAVTENEEITDFEDFESDFMETDESYKEYLQEMKSNKEREKYLIVKQKYFKQKLPNFLTWYDKEQIRYLHRTDPEEWTIERLSEGFPALPEVIKKIVKGNWTKSTQNRVLNHDASVQKNWKSFKEGQRSHLPNELVEHLNKFTNRALNLKPFTLPDTPKTIVTTKNNISTEFSDIIKSYQKLKDAQNENTQINEDKVNNPPQTETNKSTPFAKRKPVTLNKLQLDLMKKAELGKSVDEDEKHIIKSSKEKHEDITEKQDHLIDLSTNKYEKSTSLQYFKKTEKDLSHLKYPERISIPKKIYKKGTLYKLYDCYYDDDGEFLYRVPGMG